MLGNKKTIGGFNLLAIDNTRKTVAVTVDNNLYVVKLNDLVNFEWSKSIINQIVTKEQLECCTIKLPFNSHLISVSANGFGNKLLVSGCENANQSPIILFYDLYNLNENVRFNDAIC